MKILDISKGMFSTEPYPGDPKAHLIWISGIDESNDYSLSKISFCSHNATHVDAPAHYVKDGLTIDKLPLSIFCGKCLVCSADGTIPKEAEKISRILLKGKISCELATSLATHVCLVGTDENSISEFKYEKEVHNIFLKRNIPILENLNLRDVPNGIYEIAAFPLSLEGAEASPVRAVLFDTT